MTAGVFPRVLRDNRAAVLLFSLLCVVVIAWAYLLRGAGVEMDAMEMGAGQMMPVTPAWTPGYAMRVVVMWAVMMVAMMLPSAVPTTLLVAGLPRQHPEQVTGTPAAILFTASNLVVWAGFGVAAALAQWAFDRAGILSGAMASRSAAAGGLILLAAGLYQLTPLKQRCLRHCRASLDCLAQDGGTGIRATVAAGVRHGSFGVGCCGILMGLMFVGGVMNIKWTAGLALLVLVEQLLPWGRGVSHLAGAVLMAWGSLALTPAIF